MKEEICTDCKEAKPDLNDGQCRACSLKEIKKWMKEITKEKK
jgi:hypothetical protein